MLVLCTVICLLAARNVAGESVVPSAFYVPVNLAVAGLLLVLGTSHGLSAGELGLERRTIPTGARTGGAVAVVAAALIAVAVAIPATRPLFEDERVARAVHGAGDLAYQTLVRVPVGTALFEELAFRGVLLALLARRYSLRAAVAASALLFGLWHVRPTLGALDANDLASDPVTRAAAVAGAVAVTAVAGVAFALLRTMSQSLLAPLIVHASINSVATVAAYTVLR